MATVFNGNTLEITLDAPTNGVLTVNVQRLYSEWKEWMLASFQNMGYPPAFRPDGGADLTPGIKQGSYYFLRNDLGWRIKSTAESQTVYVIGNLTPQDSTLPITIEQPGFTVTYQGLQPITQNVEALLTAQTDASFRGQVTIDEVNGAAGTTGTIGLPQNPVSNITDAKTILSRVGGNKIVFRDNLTLDQDVEGYDIEGIEAVLSDNLLLEGYSLDRSRVAGCYITGAQGSNTGVGFQAIKCGFGAITGAAMSADGCYFFDDVTLHLSATNVWENCRSGVAGNGKPIITVGNNTGQLQLRAWTGGIDIRSSTNAGFFCSLDFLAGRLAFGNTNTAGNFILGGDVAKDLLDSGGATIADRSTARTIAEEPIEANFSLEEVLRLLAAAAAGTIEQATDGTYTIRGIDGTTARILGALATNNGRTISSRDAA